jgi:hypothetical protein
MLVSLLNSFKISTKYLTWHFREACRFVSMKVYEPYIIWKCGNVQLTGNYANKSCIHFERVYLLVYPLTNWLTPWGRGLLEKPQVAQVLRYFTIFYGTQSSIRCSQEFTTGPFPEPDESSPSHPHPIYLRSILVLFYYLCFSPFLSFFPSDFPTRTLYAFVSSRVC